LKVLRKPDDADAQITAHAYSAETDLQSFRIIFCISQVLRKSEKQNAFLIQTCLDQGPKTGPQLLAKLIENIHLAKQKNCYFFVN